MAAIFKSVAWQVDQLVTSIQNGSIQLPDLQRPFVWPTTKVRDLFDSMYRGYPVGELMFWDEAAASESRAISGTAGLGAVHQLIDGQQRLTSLFAAIKGAPVRTSNYREKTIVISFNPFSERFEVWTPALAKSVSWVENIASTFDSPHRAWRAFVKRWERSGSPLTEEQEEQLAHVFTKLNELKNYTFTVVHLGREQPKDLVADVFVRINSEGMRLKSSDYILTWLSVFWPEGREQIEEFAHRSRITPERASEISGERVTWTPINPFIDLDTSHLVRAMVAIGQNRARLQDAYTALQARDSITGMVDKERLDQQLALLQRALPVVTDKVNWGEFIHALQIAGFRSSRNITSTMNVVYSYVLFLLGRTQFGVDLTLLRQVIARWIFMAQLTGRYTGSSESQLSKELARLDDVPRGDAAAFVALLDDIIDAELTPDYWRFGVPQLLITSGPSLSPAYQCYLAALNILEGKMFMLDMPVSQWMDPSLPTQKGMESHHLFPRNYLSATLGIDDIKRINQAGNYAPTDWETNIQISDEPPSSYWPALLAARALSEPQLKQQMYWHALPEDWHLMQYDDFLASRRQLMAKVTQDAFEQLRSGRSGGRMRDYMETIKRDEPDLIDLFTSGAVKPGDLLDPVDPEWIVDAVISDDGTLVIDGTHVFDNLDDAARHLDVQNISGLEFWALEKDGALVELTTLSKGRL